jgi:vacuolar protein sorting-associated protein 13A/C
VPSVVRLARFKISGKLPTLQLNFSDSKYKSILRLIDVTIPKFVNGDHSTVNSAVTTSSGYPLVSGLFDLPETEYNVDDETDCEDAEKDRHMDERSREVREQTPSSSDSNPNLLSFLSHQGVELRQRQLEFSFQVTTLRASLYKSQGSAGEKPLGHVSFDDFALLLLLTEHDMKIEVHLGSAPLPSTSLSVPLTTSQFVIYAGRRTRL